MNAIIVCAVLVLFAVPVWAAEKSCDMNLVETRQQVYNLDKDRDAKERRIAELEASLSISQMQTKEILKQLDEAKKAAAPKVEGKP